MPLFSTRQGRWITRSSRPIDTGPDPYEPGTKFYAERHRETLVYLPNGLLRVDLGEPIPRLSCESPAVTRKARRKAPAVGQEPVQEPAPPVWPARQRTEPLRHPTGHRGA